MKNFQQILRKRLKPYESRIKNGTARIPPFQSAPALFRGGASARETFSLPTPLQRLGAEKLLAPQMEINNFIISIRHLRSALTLF